MVYALTSCFIVLDILTGLIKAFKERKYNSTIMREGLYHKAGSIICIVLAGLVDYTQSFIDLGVTVPVTLGVCVYIIGMEIGSIIENVCTINPEILPNQLKGFFSKLSDGGK